MDNAREINLANLSSAVQAEIDRFLNENQTELIAISSDFNFVLSSLRRNLAGGKRLRPAFALAGFLAAGGVVTNELIRALTALEFVQASALIHDDLMDSSDIRRGLPTIHKQFAALHAESNWHGNSADFGGSSAILLGMLCLVWADQIYFNSGFSTPDLLRAKPIYDSLRVEVMAGQYLDVLEQNRRLANPAEIQIIVQHKTAKYTVERPLLLGAELSGASEKQKSALSEYGLAIGEAFQYRDDLLGVMGDAAVTGKPVGDDLREGKRTLLVAFVHEVASDTQWNWFENLLGNSNLSSKEIQQAQSLLVELQVVQRVEDRITELESKATKALAEAEFSAAGLELLKDLTTAALVRNK